MGVIYKITGPTGKVYIGKSINFKARLREHRKASRTVNSHLYRAVRKYGWGSFTKEVVETVSDDMLSEREIFWIVYYDSYENTSKGYNMTSGGDGGCTTKDGVCYTDGYTTIKLSPNTSPPEGFILGSSNTTNLGKSWSWYNDGNKEFWIQEVSEIGELIKGRLPTIGITNGVKNKQLKPGEVMPEGWYRGSSSRNTKGRIWVNNGSISKMIHAEDIQNGWIIGMAKANKAREVQNTLKADPNRKLAWNSGKRFRWITDGKVSRQIPIELEIPNGFTKGRCANY